MQEQSDWEIAETLRRYARLAADYLAPYAERVCVGAGESSDHGTFTAQA